MPIGDPSVMTVVKKRRETSLLSLSKNSLTYLQLLACHNCYTFPREIFGPIYNLQFCFFVCTNIAATYFFLQCFIVPILLAQMPQQISVKAKVGLSEPGGLRETINKISARGHIMLRIFFVTDSLLSFGGPQLYNLEVLPFTYDSHDQIELADKHLIHLYLIFEKSSWKNQVRRTGFLIEFIYFELDFYYLCSLQKSINQ